MKSQWLVRLLWGISLSIILVACLAGKNTPAVKTPASNAPVVGLANTQVVGQPQAQANLPYKEYLPAIAQPLPPQPTMPLASNSIYITSLDPTTLYNQGCALGLRDLNLEGKQDSVAILHFGYPRMVNNQFGARLYYPATGATNAQIASAAESFGYGYWYCVGADFDSHLQIGIGTSNYGGSIYSLVTYGHGQAWARMVNDVNNWFTNVCQRGCDGQVSAVGASDLELSWNDYATSVDWLNGYDQANNSPLYNFGAIPGCPYLSSPNAQCGGGGYYWTKEQVWMVTYGLSPVFPMPEIYRTDGVNAQQWYLMSLYSYNTHGIKMNFIGPMSQYQACLQRGGCAGINNTPAQAWQQLSDLLNGDLRTAGETLPYLTDIFWLNEPIPSSAALAAQATPQPVPSSQPGGAALLASLQEDLNAEKLGAAERASLQEKQKLARQLPGALPAKAASGGPAARGGQKTTDQSLLTQKQSQAASVASDEEIIEGSEGLVHTWEASIQNLWQGEREGVFYQVLAGADVNDAQQGLLLVIETIPGQNQRSQHFYLTAEKTGALRILKVQAKRVILQIANGSQLTFDLDSRTFK